MSNEEKKMSRHKHAFLMLQYAEDAAKTDKPWELWEARRIDESPWSNLGQTHPRWANNYEYRRKPVKWSPVGGDWWVKGEGYVVEALQSPLAKEFGTERPTQQQAERAAVEMRKFNRLLALRDELCGDVMVDWTNFKQEKFYLSHDEENKRWHIRSSFMSKASVAYFTTLESAQRACDMLNSGEVEL